jgi:nicotinamidase/pyrazinamidase
MTRALIIVDVQNDFLPTGALPVPQGDAVIPVVNALSPRFDLVVATQDWHPADHGSFARNHPGKKPYDAAELAGLPQVLWPAHCVQHTPGAELAPGLDASRIARIVQKGTDRAIDSYSGFFDNGHRRATGLAEHLRGQGVDEVFVVGLATDYCVKFTALDAQQLGFKTTVIEDACRGVDVRPGDVAAALDELRAAGVTVTRSGELAVG